jgi:hypothetical protein
MAKHTFGEYSAFHTQGGVRFMKNSKLISEKVVPPEVVAFLKNKLSNSPTRAMPTPEESAQLKAESIQVRPELQATPEKVAEDAAQADHLTSEDFDAPQEIVAEHPTETAAREATAEMSEFMESVSIHTASIGDIAEALSSRFGIYTVWLQRLPAADEVNPLTGEGFTKYHLGIAYQAAVRAKSQGLLDPTHQRQTIDAGRAAHDNVAQGYDPRPITVRENREANSFAFRTSPIGTKPTPQTQIVHEQDEKGRVRAVQKPIIQGEPSDTGEKNGAGVVYDAQEDAPLVQPNLSGKPVIRPDW